MQQMAADVDVVIIGAGAAGIAAARRLAASHLSAIVLEATARVGGRAWTCEVAGMRLDLGCGWLHSADRNPWTRIAEAAGFVVDRRAPAWGRQYQDIGFSQTDQAAARRAYAAWEQRMESTPPASDCAADALEPEGEWNAYLQAISGFMNGAGLEHISVADYTAYDAASTGCNWRTPAGYGTVDRRQSPSPDRLAPVDAGPVHRTGQTRRGVDDAGRRRPAPGRLSLPSRPRCWPGAQSGYRLVWTLGVTPRLASRLDATKSSSSRSWARVRSPPRRA